MLLGEAIALRLGAIAIRFVSGHLFEASGPLQPPEALCILTFTNSPRGETAIPGSITTVATTTHYMETPTFGVVVKLSFLRLPADLV